MIYIFEDSPGSWVQKCLMDCYEKGQTVGKIFYTSGNRYILTKLDELLAANHTDEEVVIFLDVVPDNKNTVMLYNQINKTYKQKFSKLIVLPIPCIEFYYIKQLQYNNKVILDNNQVNDVVSRGWHKHSRLKKNFDECRTYWQFEKFCKLVLKRAFKKCIKPKDHDSPLYYRFNCKMCRYRRSECYNPNFASLINKHRSLIKSFPCVPMGTNIGCEKYLSWGDLIVIHRQLVIQYNIMAVKYNKIDAKELGLDSIDKLPPKYACKQIEFMY